MSRTAAYVLLLSVLLSAPGCGGTRVAPPAKTQVPVTPTAAANQPRTETSTAPFKGNPAPPMPGSRLWTSADQTAQFRAIVVWLHGDKVRLRKWDGLTVTVTLDQLSQADRDWLAANAQKFDK
jgi:SLA1 homology domain 1, SHD1